MIVEDAVPGAPNGHRRPPAPRPSDDPPAAEVPVVPAAPAGALLETLLEHLGPAVLDIVAAPRGLQVPLRAPLIYDPSTPPSVTDGDVLLAVGIPASGSRAIALIELAARRGASAVTFKGRQHADVLAGAADRAGVAALIIPDELGWDDFHAMVRTVVATTTMPTEGDALALHGPPLDDLFALADAAAGNLNGPVAIHDHRMRVAAFSTLEQPLDELGKHSILRRTPPDSLIEWLERTGLLRQMLSSPEPVRIEREGIMPRLALAIRSGSDILGWVMVAEGAEPLAREAPAILAEVARVAALELVRLKSVEDIERRLRAEVFRSVLEARGSATLLATRLNFPADTPCSLIGLAIDPGAGEAADALPSVRLRDLATLRLEALDRRSVTVTLGPTIYGLVPAGPDGACRSVVDLVEQVIAHASRSLGTRVRATYGEMRDGLAELAVARAEADRALRRLVGEPSERAVAPWDEFSAHAVLEQLKDLATAHPRVLLGPIAGLAEIDRKRGSAHIATLRAFLDSACDLTAAAARLQIHRNTLRYRIQRITEISGLDLSQPNERLVAELQLRLLETPGALGAED
jgi:hypothetical protein